MPKDNDITAFLADFQCKVKASRGKVSPENDAVLAIAELWVERELQIEEARTKIEELKETLSRLAAVHERQTSLSITGSITGYCSGAVTTMTFPGYAQKVEEKQ